MRRSSARVLARLPTIARKISRSTSTFHSAGTDAEFEQQKREIGARRQQRERQRSGALPATVAAVTTGNSSTSQ